MRGAVEEVLAEVLMRWEASENRLQIWEILVPTGLPFVSSAEYDPNMVRCFRLALPHAVSLPAVRLYLAGLPLEANTGPLDVYPISEAWAHALRDFVHATPAPVVSYISARRKFRFAYAE
eukprot:2210740-Pleurochrysis_carterae.AAC.1